MSKSCLGTVKKICGVNVDITGQPSFSVQLYPFLIFTPQNRRGTLTQTDSK